MNRSFDERQRVIRQAKDVPCADCGVKYPPHVMHFDHLPPFPKRYNVGAMIHHRGMSALLDEIAKCEVVCANCHAERTWRRSAEGRVEFDDGQQALELS